MEQRKDMLYLLKSRGVCARGFFQIGSDPGACYGVSRGGAVYGLDLGPAPLDENDIWERLEQIHPISKAEFEAAQSRHRGAPTAAQLEPLAQWFAAEYSGRHALGRWKAAARYGEETMRRIAGRAAGLLAAERALDRAGQKRLRDRMFADLARARAEQLSRGPGRPFKENGP
ncbi:hypothetical protein [Allofournierella sp.]|uniref:hypothetical protein n=1 Tax=Allofournierella sp. TaxID=1940256 RepID=UPI003AB2CDB8